MATVAAKWSYKGKTYESDGKGNTTVTSNRGNSGYSPNNTGYGIGKGYGDRETAYTWKDGTTTYSNATRYEDAAKEAGKVGVGLSSAVSYGSSGQQKQNGNNNIYSKNTATGKNYENALRYEQQVANNYGLGTDPSAGKYGYGYGYTDTYYTPSYETAMLPGIADNLGVNQNTAYGNIQDFAVNQDKNNIYQNVNPYIRQNPYDELLKNSKSYYNDMEDRTKLIYEALLKQGIDKLEANRQGIKDNYEDSASQAYIAKLRADRDLKSQLEASGLNGGATETGRIQIANNYLNNLNTINTGLNKEMANLDNSIADFTNTNNVQMQQAILQNSQAALDAYNALMQNKINYDYTANRDYISDQRYNKEYADNMLWREKEYAASQEQQKYNQAYNMLQLGFGTAETAGILGLSQSQVQAYVDLINQQRQQELQSGALDLKTKQAQYNKLYNSPTVSSRNSGGSSKSSGGSGGTKKSTLTYAQARKELEEGNYTPAALAVYKAYNGEGYKTVGSEKIEDIYQKAKALGKDYSSFRNAVSQMYSSGQISESDIRVWEYTK